MTARSPALGPATAHGTAALVGAPFLATAIGGIVVRTSTAAIGRSQWSSEGRRPHCCSIIPAHAPKLGLVKAAPELPSLACLWTVTSVTVKPRSPSGGQLPHLPATVAFFVRISSRPSKILFLRLGRHLVSGFVSMR